MKTIGLTGGIGTGKSAVSAIMKKHNAAVIDADQVNHRILNKDRAAYHEIVAAFSEHILDDSRRIDRKKLGAVVFADEQALALLTRITHRYISVNVKRELEMLKRSAFDWIVIEAPLLIEAGLHQDVDEVWLMAADLEVRVCRVIERDGRSRAEILKIIEKQTDFCVLRRFAHEVIWNNGGLDALERAVTALLQKRSWHVCID